MSKNPGKLSRTFVFLGISGSGKGTQAAFLMKVLPQVVNISTGDGLRAISKRKNRVGLFVKNVLNRGGLSPMWAVAHIWLSEFVESLRGDENAIFDGAPRRVDEARLMDDFMRDVGRPLPVAIYLRLSRKEAMRRLLERGRFDDNGKAIQNRFRFFRDYVQPVIDYYKRHKRLAVINGEQSVPGVWRDIRKALRL